MERFREWLVVSVLAINHAHEVRALDPCSIVRRRQTTTLRAMLDGDIPALIGIHESPAGPAWIDWLVWPDDNGRRTRGGASVHRLSATMAVLAGGPYDRSRKRSDRLARIPLPDAKWGLTSPEFERFRIITTY
jgi:hypothetical protein